MKKNIALLLSIIALILLISFLRVNIDKEYLNPAGNIISDGIYAYDLQTNGLSVNGLTTKKEELYYLLMEELDPEQGLYSYQLKKLNIYTGKITDINTIKETKSFCSLKEETIDCISETSLEIYDLNLDQIYSYPIYEDITTTNFAPYKDIYVKIEGLDIYLILENKASILYRTIDTETTLLFEDFFVTDDNTYILYLDEEGNHLLYDINEEKLITLGQTNYFKYANGLVFYDMDTFKIYDLVNREIAEYTNPTGENYYYTGTMKENKSVLYLYDAIDNFLYIENMSEGLLSVLDTTLLSDSNPLANLMVVNNYLYVYVLQDKDNFYVLDLENLNLETTKIIEYKEKITSSINEAISNIKTNYNVNINIKEDAIIKFPDFSAEALVNDELILESLYKIETILSKYDLEFFNSFYDNNYNGLNLYLTGELTPSDYETQAANPAAYSLMFQNEYMIVIDLNQPNIEELLCHELLHNLEFHLNNEGIYPFGNWSNYNPSDFYYDNSYTSNSGFDYTLNEDDKNNVYFIDTYSHTYETEDRARVFEKICPCESDSIVNDYPNLYQKGLYLKEEITTYYPSLAHTNLFNSLN